ncbi:rRNA maturation RNase YbeY [Dokdonella koreensis]|uniref:Endoribonuclease YbeY n=1 Tax=Dokdonella koreensis DS-123 TaxID=1300342 RepID=A0A160DX51_9GAMM|nr:rRNA maturation RNase YbeY [Dokdonella koreensis]ANB19275.1 Metal-dependent hydrolase YbeY, involved in rRNA and/or ribosome maturation and assembly [Dokdonella koreensis DS-123]
MTAEPTVHLSLAVGLLRRGLPQRTSFARWVAAAVAAARRRRATELSIRLVGVDEGRLLNVQYRGRDYATNVLSFPADLPPGLRLPLIGDLVICAPVVAREAAEQGKTARDHYAHLTVHGVLHLLGYDHEADADAERMEALETRVLAGLGVADPYRD